MKVAIIGYGFVGKALSDGFLDTVEVLKIDPKLESNINEITKFCPEIVFICLPTPMKDDSSQDISIVKEVTKEISQINTNSLLVIKSTILPDNIEDLSKLKKDFIYNPEFLREKHAKEDFINSELIIFGGSEGSSHLLSEFYKNHTKCINTNHIFTDKITASLIKYTINSFLATKVIFFNEINKIFESIDSKETWENFTKYLSRDKRIGDSHMMVPGHDGRLGFGGACLPKDINALVKYAESKNIQLNLIKDVIKTNNKIRASYNNTTHREDEQNINYNNLDEE